MNWQRDIEVLTPLFNRGAYQDTPEIRVPSIRGMVRWWFRALGGTRDQEKALFGGVHGGAVASRLIFRVKILSATVAQPPGIYTLPHKPPARDPQNLNTERDPRAPRAAFKQGASFRLEVFSRFGNLPPELETKAKNALEVWLLLGSLGLRANRGGGNVWPADGSAPKTPAELRQRLDQHGCRWPVMLAGREVGQTVEQLRKAATDTKNGLPQIFGEASRNRQASIVKFKIVRLGNELRLLITAPDNKFLDQARAALRGKLSWPETWQLISA